MTLLIILGILTAATSIAGFVFFILVLIRLFKKEGVLLGILGIFCSIYTFIWGWMKHKELEMTKIMIWWSGLTAANIILAIVLQVAAPMALMSLIGKDQAATITQQQATADAKKAAPAKKAKPSEPVKEFEITDYGIYHVEFTGETVKNETAPEGARNVIKSYKLLQKTEKIPAEIGTFFGFEYKLNGKDAGKKVQLILHNNFPGLKDPDQEKVLEASETIEEAIVGEKQLVLFDFREEWELVPGKWTFQLFRDGKLLGEKTFTVETL